MYQKVYRAYASIKLSAIKILLFNNEWYYLRKSNETVIDYIQNGKVNLHYTQKYNKDTKHEAATVDDWEIIYWLPDQQAHMDELFAPLVK